MKEEMKQQIEAAIKTAVELVFDAIEQSPANGTSPEAISESVCNELKSRSIPDERESRVYAREEAEAVFEDKEDEVKDWATDAATEAVDFDEGDSRGWAREEAEEVVDGLTILTEDDVCDAARQVVRDEQVDEETIERMIDEKCFNDSLTCAKTYTLQWEAHQKQAKHQWLTELKTEYRLEKIQAELSASLPPLPQPPQPKEEATA